MGAGKGYDFPANLIDLCVDCHIYVHANNDALLVYKLEVQSYLYETLAAPTYLPEDLVWTIEIPRKQAYKVVKPLWLVEDGYAREDVIRQLMGGKTYDWREADAV